MTDTTEAPVTDTATDTATAAGTGEAAPPAASPVDAVTAKRPRRRISRLVGVGAVAALLGIAGGAGAMALFGHGGGHGGRHGGGHGDSHMTSEMNDHMNSGDNDG